MRDVAVTEGDKVEAQIRLGWTVDYWPVGDLVPVINSVSDEDVQLSLIHIWHHGLLRPVGRV